ncbi:MAG: site-specific integrase [Muribaculaceae bacterium]|nr:site-specific integrase [Muribaculaceae bacterium]
MTSIKVKFRPSTSEGREGKIYFQIIHERIVRQWYSDYKIFSNEWDSKKSAIVISNGTERRAYLQSVRERIKWDKERFNRVIIEFSSRDSYTADDIVEEFITRQHQQCFFNFMENVIVRLKELGKLRTSQTYTSALNSFRNFKNNEDVVFDGFNSDLMESYQAHLTKKGLIPNSISFHMRILRAVYNRAIEKGITEDKRPFRHVYTGVDKTTKRAVDVKTLKKIKEADLGMKPNAAYARDIFLLSFYFRGMSFVDMAYLKKSDLSNGQIIYRRRKTGQQLAVKWTKQMQEILGRYPKNETEYLLPIITSTSGTPYSQYRSKQYQINRGLKAVAESIGLKMPLTLYCSRHSWASIAKSKGIPVGVISDGLGHDSELTTQIYLSTLDTSAVDKANDLIMKLI